MNSERARVGHLVFGSAIADPHPIPLPSTGEGTGADLMMNDSQPPATQPNDWNWALVCFLIAVLFFPLLIVLYLIFR